MLYGLGNLLENAVDFARERVVVDTQWSDDAVAVTISDDGPGFAPDILVRIGEPYVTTRRRNPDDVNDEPSGLGLGFFIAKTLLERSGATLNFENRAAPDRGATITIALAPQRFRAPVDNHFILRIRTQFPFKVV